MSSKQELNGVFFGDHSSCRPQSCLRRPVAFRAGYIDVLKYSSRCHSVCPKSPACDTPKKTASCFLAWAPQ